MPPFPEIDLLKTALKQSVRHYDETSAGIIMSNDRDIKVSTRPLEMVEEAENATLKKVYLDGISSEGLVLKLDHFGIQFFEKHTWNQACDYIVLTEDSHKKYALFIELKSSIEHAPTPDGHLQLNGNRNVKIAWQLNSGSALFDYLCFVIDTLHKDKTLLQYDRKFIVLYARHSSGVRSFIQPMQGCTSRKQDFKHQTIKAISINEPSSSRLSVADLIA